FRFFRTHIDNGPVTLKIAGSFIIFKVHPCFFTAPKMNFFLAMIVLGFVRKRPELHPLSEFYMLAVPNPILWLNGFKIARIDDYRSCIGLGLPSGKRCMLSPKLCDLNSWIINRSFPFSHDLFAIFLLPETYHMTFRFYERRGLGSNHFIGGNP